MSAMFYRRCCRGRSYFTLARILVANVVWELCAGKGFLFADRGEVVLRGFEDPVRLYEVSWREAA
jgi:class 3 adenylate cyclase